MTIQWYPGHMGKAHKEISEMVGKTDVIIEVLDARLPASSSNILLTKLRRNKPCIKVLNKNDLADPAVTRAWVRTFEKQAGVCALPLSAKQHREAKQLIRLCQRLAPHRGKPGNIIIIQSVADIDDQALFCGVRDSHFKLFKILVLV